MKSYDDLSDKEQEKLASYIQSITYFKLRSNQTNSEYMMFLIWVSILASAFLVSGCVLASNFPSIAEMFLIVSIITFISGLVIYSLLCVYQFYLEERINRMLFLIYGYTGIKTEVFDIKKSDIDSLKKVYKKR